MEKNKKNFQLIDGPEVPPSIKPMTELHDKLVIGYNKGRDIKLPKLIQSMEKRVCEQIDAMCELESQLQDSLHKLGKTTKFLQGLMFHEDIPQHVTEELMHKMDKLYG